MFTLLRLLSVLSVQLVQSVNIQPPPPAPSTSFHISLGLPVSLDTSRQKNTDEKKKIKKELDKLAEYVKTLGTDLLLSLVNAISVPGGLKEMVQTQKANTKAGVHQQT